MKIEDLTNQVSNLESTVADNKEQCKNKCATLKTDLESEVQGSDEETEILNGVIASLEEQLSTVKSQVEALTGQLDN